MSNAGRETKWISRSTRCASQIRPPVQRRTASPGGRTAWLPHTGQTSGYTNGFASFGRRSVTTETICGITSPARCSTTVSPMRMSLRAISSSLCSVAFCTSTPPTFTGSQPRDRRQRAGAADLDADVLQHGHRLFRGELPGDRPARRAADEAEPALQREVVDLVDHAIDVVAEAGAFHSDLRLEGRGLGLAVQLARQRVHLEPPVAQTLQIVPVRIGNRLARLALGIGEQRQRPLRGDARIELAQAAGGGVARVGEHLLAGRGLRLVHLRGSRPWS